MVTWRPAPKAAIIYPADVYNTADVRNRLRVRLAGLVAAAGCLPLTAGLILLFPEHFPAFGWLFVTCLAVVAAYLGGWVAGATGGLLSLLTVGWLTRTEATGPATVQLARIGLALAGIGLVSYLAYRRERAEERLRLSHQQLASRVEERTASLSQALARLELEVEQRDRLAANLRLQVAILNALMDAVDYGIVVVSPQREWTFVNRRYAALWNLPPDVAATRSRDDALPIITAQLVDPAGFLATLEYAYTHPDEEIRQELRLKDGRVFEKYGVAVRAEDGTYLGRVWFYREVTAQRRAEAELRFHQILLEAQMEASEDGIVVVSPDRRWLLFNRRFAELWGLPEEVVRSRSREQGLPIILGQLHNEAEIKALLDRIYDEPTESARGAMYLKDGRVFQFYTAPVHDQAGNYYARVWFYRDVTEMHRAEANLRRSELRFRSLIERASDVIILMDRRGIITYAGPSITRLFGYDPAELVGKPGARFVHPDDREQALEFFRSSVAEQTGASRGIQLRILTKDGQTRVIDWLVTNLLDDPVISGVVLNGRDVTDRVAIEGELRQTNARLQATIRLLQRRNEENRIFVEMAELLRTCRTLEEAYRVVGNFGQALFPSGQGILYVVNASRNLLEAVAAWGPQSGDEAPLVFDPGECWALRRGRLHVLDESAVSVGCGHVRPGTANSYLCVPLVGQTEPLGLFHIRFGDPVIDDDRRRLALELAQHVAMSLVSLRMQEALRNQAIRDPLTGLFNRRYMEESLEREIRRAIRHGSSVGIIMLDIDHFKQFNDIYGHTAGDILLQALGRVLQSSVRAEDIACRYGGEEFVLILPDATLQDTFRRAEQVRLRIRELTIQHRGQRVPPITVSAGVAAAPDHGETVDALISAADFALYRAKAEGRDCVAMAPRPEGSGWEVGQPSSS